MTVVTHPDHAIVTKPGQRCAFCHKPASVPYVEWWICLPEDYDALEEDPSIAICTACCRSLKRALVQDLVRAVAFDDFHKAVPINQVRQ
jgi:hypothetical protein